MTDKMKTLLKEKRARALRAMHDFMCEYVADEELWDEWLIMGVPDEPDDSDFDFLADDVDEFQRVYRLFARLVTYDATTYR